ncbi:MULTISPECIES: hypothetical protein [Methylobacterium]|uniref:hypothetical protein n=1 Tax=Methylobacterium TaxID=407 RepID=UPI000A5C347A|nr:MULTISPECIES: hypothetical protein [Methylobacterium]MCI9880970.1 hypothetical protein [Methylobacterium goesingense]
MSAMIAARVATEAQFSIRREQSKEEGLQLPRLVAMGLDTAGRPRVPQLIRRRRWRHDGRTG